MTLCVTGRKIKKVNSEQGQYQENQSGLAEYLRTGGKFLRYICYLVYPTALSSTVWPQYKTRQIDRRTADMLVRIARLTHCALHALNR